MGSPSPSSGAAKKRRAKKISPAVLARLPLKAFAARQLASRLERAESQWNRCAESAGADEIHDLRVSLRRFDETLWLFRRLFPKRERRQVRSELKNALGFAGATRDVDIALESFEAASIVVSPRLRLHLESARAMAEAALVATLAVGRRTGVIERWRRALALQPDGSFDALLQSIPSNGGPAVAGVTPDMSSREILLPASDQSEADVLGENSRDLETPSMATAGEEEVPS